eukprot:SM000117S25531  [mRNA]  locus=s117:325377:330370:+ [translate_table: standard]
MAARTTLSAGLIDLRTSSQAADEPDDDDDEFTSEEADDDGITSEEVPTTACSVAFPPSLTARQRAALHEAAKEHGLQHGSKTDSQGRRMLTITRPFAEGRHVVVPMEEAGLTDACLGELTESLLGLKLDGKLQLCSGTAAMGLRREQGSGSSGRGESADVLTVESFVHSMDKLLDLEKDAELARSTELATLMKPETAQRRGLALLNLKCVDETPGLFGRTLLFWRPHDIVALKRSDAEPSSPVLEQGMVYDLNAKEDSITVVVDSFLRMTWTNLSALRGWSMKVPQEWQPFLQATYKMMKDTLMRLTQGVLQGPAAYLVPTLFGTRPPSFAGVPPVVNFYNRQLDHSQQAAVAKALSAYDVFLLHGPPGTGKTTVVVEIILQEVSRGRKVLACAASNIAVDNLVERLATTKVKLIRLGHPARLLPQVLDCSLDAQVLPIDNSILAKYARKQMKDRRDRANLRRDLRCLAMEERKRQQPLVAAIIQNSRVILTTPTGASNRYLDEVRFDVVVIDEAAQALEAVSWIALLKGRRCVLAGDHLRLPPTVLSKEAERHGLGVTLFVNAHSLVAGHKLLGLDGVSRTATSEATLVLVDTTGCEMEEAREEEGDSWQNDGEAHVVIAYAERLLDAGVAATDIGIITPYSAQVACLKELRGSKQVLAPVEVLTVDGFQGREKEAIIISMVRSNDRGEAGFLAERRRMNVAATRARRQCCVICNRDTVTHDEFLKDMIDYFEIHGELLSAIELYPQQCAEGQASGEHQQQLGSSNLDR